VPSGIGYSSLMLKKSCWKRGRHFCSASLMTLSLFWFSLSTGTASANDIYIAQNATGSANGSSCANAFGVTFFNTSGNWGSGASQIGPETTVHLCGTVSTALTSHGSGTSGNPITILFESGAKISMPACPSTGCLDVSGSSYIVINGGTACGHINGPSVAATPCNGIVESTLNGTPGYTCTAGACSSQANTNGVNLCSGCELKNLTIRNMYVKDPGNLSDDASNCGCQGVIGNPGHIHNLILHDNLWSVTMGIGSSLEIDHISCYNTDHCVAVIGPGSGGSFHDSEDYSPYNWDTTDNVHHHDGIHLYNPSGSTQTASNFQIYNNYFWGDWGGSNTTAYMFIEGNMSSIVAFNNLMIPCNVTDAGTCHSISGGDGWESFHLNGGSVGANNNRLWNNTLIGNFGWNYGQTNFGFENNVFSSQEVDLIDQTSPSFPFSLASGAVDYNVYDGTFSVRFHSGGYSSLSSWRSASGQEAHSITGSANLNTYGVPGTGSAAKGAAANLTAQCSTYPALCSDILGNPRPATGAWDAGAYVVGGAGSTVLPPTGMTVIVK